MCIVLAARVLSPDLLLVALALMGLIVVGVITIVWVDRWRKRPTTEKSGEELALFRQMVEQGTLSAEEFERIRSKLEGWTESGGPSSTAVKAAEPPSTTDGIAAEKSQPPRTAEPPGAG
jgi:hypothetical protein